jgi:hypothetical protein
LEEEESLTFMIHPISEELGLAQTNYSSMLSSLGIKWINRLKMKY